MVYLPLSLACGLVIHRQIEDEKHYSLSSGRQIFQWRTVIAQAVGQFDVRYVGAKTTNRSVRHFPDGINLTLLDLHLRADAVTIIHRGIVL